MNGHDNGTWKKDLEIHTIFVEFRDVVIVIVPARIFRL